MKEHGQPFVLIEGPDPFIPYLLSWSSGVCGRQKQWLFDSVVLAIQTLGNVELLRRLRLLTGSWPTTDEEEWQDI